MRQIERDEVRGRYNFRCGYCGVSESDIGARHTIDHFKPRSRSGSDEPENLVYCCFACNSVKGDFWTVHPTERILHPINDDISDHISPLPDGKLLGVTASGRFHIDKLQLNRPDLVAYRAVRIDQTRQTESLRDSINRLEELRQRVAQLEAAVADAERRLSSQ